MAQAMLDEELIAMIRRVRGVRLTPLQRAVEAEALRRNLEHRNTGLPGCDPEAGVGAGLRA